jgi:serine/threonine protein kinase
MTMAASHLDTTMRSAKRGEPPARPKRISAMRLRFPRALEQHLVSAPIASGGMASIHVAVTADQQQRVLALKRVHPHLASANFTKMLLDEAALGACIRHENVVTTYGADMIGDEVFMVMEYVPGLPLHVIMQKAQPLALPARFAVAIVADALRGLHAAHEAVDERGDSLGIVHRDVSPQNIMLGQDGIARVLDFGIAKAERRAQETACGDLKGKLSYMAPEQLRGDAVDRRTDVYAASVVLWETLVGASLFNDRSDAGTFANALRGCSTRPGLRVRGIPPELDAIVMRGLATRPEDRFATALDMARALDGVVAFNPVRPNELGAWLRELGADALEKRAQVPEDLRRRNAPPVAPVPPTARPALARLDVSTLASLGSLAQRLGVPASLFVAGSIFGLLLTFAISRL